MKQSTGAAEALQARCCAGRVLVAQQLQAAAVWRAPCDPHSPANDNQLVTVSAGSMCSVRISASFMEASARAGIGAFKIGLRLRRQVVDSIDFSCSAAARAGWR